MSSKEFRSKKLSDMGKPFGELKLASAWSREQRVLEGDPELGGCGHLGRRRCWLGLGRGSGMERGRDLGLDGVGGGTGCLSRTEISIKPNRERNSRGTAATYIPDRFPIPSGPGTHAVFIFVPSSSSQDTSLGIE